MLRSAYLSPPDFVERGRKLDGKTFDELTAQLEPGEHLIARHSGAFVQSQVIVKPEEFSQLEYEIAVGRKSLMGYHAVRGEVKGSYFVIAAELVDPDEIPF